MKNSSITVTDQFCGAGGSSLGADALGLDVRLALNHWPLAIETHNKNFPDTDHDCADMSATNPRRYYPTDILLTSPECTNHSIAKGARRRHAQMSLFGDKVDPAVERSRATMWDVPRFAEVHNYNLVIVENVVDARLWINWEAWLLAMNQLGYNHQIVYLNSMFAHLDPRLVRSVHDFVCQSRDRMYVVFWKKGNKAPDLEIRPLAWCPRCERQVEAVQTWKPTRKVVELGGRWGRYGFERNQYLYACSDCLWHVHQKYGSQIDHHHLLDAAEVVPYHFAAFNAIDWSLPAERIGDRDKPLKPKTMKRIREGLRRFGNQYLIIDMMREGRAGPMVGTLFTQTTAQTVGVVSPFVVDTLFSGKLSDISGQLPTLTTRQSHALVYGPHALTFPPGFITSYYGGGGQLSGMGDPLGSLTTIDRHALVQMPFLLGYANGEGPPKPASKPLRTLHTENNQAVVIATVAAEDCSFRMLQPHEIGRGMAFPGDYVVLGTKREQVRQYGNAVTPPAMKLLLERCTQTLL